MPAVGTQSGKSSAGQRKARIPRKPKSTSPSGDQAGATGIKRADTHKRTPAYHKALRDTYREQPVAVRRVIAANAPKSSPAARVHEQRHKADLRMIREVGFLPRVRYDNTPAVTKRNVMPDDSAARAKALGWTPAQYKQNKDLLSHKPETKGFKAAGVLDRAATLPALVIPGAVKSAGALAEATYHDPIGVPSKTAKQLALATAATPVALVGAVAHPKKTAEGVVNSMYDSYSEPYDKKVEHIRKEGGLQDAVNVATVLGPTSRALSIGALGGAERAGLRISGGVVKDRKPRSGAITNHLGKAIDTQKAKRYERLASKGKPLTGQQAAALKANRAAGRVVEVVPTRVNSKVVKDVAKQRGRGVTALGYDLSKGDLGQVRKKLAALSDQERRALWFASAGGIRTADQARALLPALKAKILLDRKDAPKGRYKKMDMVERINEVLADPEAHFTQHLDDVMNDVAPHLQRISVRDPRYADLTKEARRRADQNVLLSLEQGVGVKPHITAHEAAGGVAVAPLRYADETDADFVKRGDAAAAEAGLRKPMYFKAERHRGEQPDYSAFAVGGGRAMALEGKHKGRNLRKGILDMSERAFLRGYARNIKAAHNWPLVADMIERHAFEDLTPGRGLNVSDALDAINKAEPELEPGSVALINPGVFRERLEQDVDRVAGDEGLPEDFGSANVLHAMRDATINPGEGVPEKLTQTTGWKAVPTSMLRELEAEMKSGTKGGRVLDVAKGKASRAILLTANVPWLALQAVSEGAVTAAVTKGGALSPVNWLGTRRWWKEMSHEDRQEVAAVLGMNSSAADLKQTRLGATSTNGFVNGWRAMKEAPIWHKDRKWLAGHGISELNPAELMAAADRGKTNITRLLAAHSELKKAAVADMAKNMSAYDKAVTKLQSVFSQPVAKQYEALKANPHLLEDVGEKLVDWLGDWTTMSAAERKVINRAVMFYPYVRYATRLLFWTLPSKHPIVTTALAELGQLTAEEYRQVFGDDDLPWNIGKVYFGETGDAKSIDLARTNPLMTSLVSGVSRIGTSSSNVPGAAIGSLPPYGQWLVDQATGVNTFKGRPLRLHGDTDPFYNKPSEISVEDHLKLATAQVESLFYPAREAMQRLHPESQSDESSLLFPTPMKYKKASEIEGNGTDAKIRRAEARNAEANQRFNEEHNGGLPGLALGPLLPTPSRDKTASEERRYVKKLKAKADADAAKRKRYRDTHGGKNPPKPRAFGGRGSGAKPFGARGGAKPFGAK